MNLQEMLCVDRCLDMDQLINFGTDPGHSRDPGNWIFAFQLDTKEVTDGFRVLHVDSCGGLHDLIRFWNRTWIQNCKADSAKSNGQISIKFYG